MDLIKREFKVCRGKSEKFPDGFVQVYPFTTYSVIFDPHASDPIIDMLFTYFEQVFIEGVPEGNEKKSVSGARLLMVDSVRSTHEIVQMAYDADYINRESYQHEHMERHLLRNDPFTVAVEIPVWDDEYRGHIDILRLCFDAQISEHYVELWDFKPNAAQEKKAASQVARYRQLLSVRTGIPLRKIRAGYFDNKNAYFLKD